MIDIYANFQYDEGEYYASLPKRIGADTLTREQFQLLEELGLLADRDDQGVLLQVFTKPLGDRPTIFIEIIQRIGCDRTPEGNLLKLFVVGLTS